jgi:hypothetical protein
MSVWKFSIDDDIVEHGRIKRGKVTKNGCNEPYKNSYWCPKLQWFRREPCPFINRQECENYRTMCGAV